MAEAVVSNIAGIVLRKLSSHVIQKSWLPSAVEHELGKLKSTVSSIRSVLLDAEEQSSSSKAIKDWLQTLKEAIYDAEELLDDLCTEAMRRQAMNGDHIGKKVRLFFSHSNQLAYGFKMAYKVKHIRCRLEEIIEIRTFHLNKSTGRAPAPMARAREQTVSSSPEITVGREDDKEKIIEFLLNSDYEENVSVISVVGIGGLGKTTLAQLVYNEKQVETHFELKLWVSVGEDFYIKLIVNKILESVTGESHKDFEMDMLKDRLYEKIYGRKYLIVLDDVWNENSEEWLHLKDLIIGGAKGSKVIITTRSQSVAMVIRSDLVYELKGLSEPMSWSLFKQIAFEPGQVPTSSQEAIGKEIVKKGMGVPLAIRAIGSVLYGKKMESEWRSFKEEKLSKLDVEEKYVLPTLKLSYDHLPSHLKYCFAYCMLFPKDYEFDVEMLIHLWMGQGYVNSLNSSECLEDIGLEYLRALLQRSFFQEVKTDELDNIKSCKMNNLMHDLATSVAGLTSKRINSNSMNVDEKTYHLSFGFHLDSTWQAPVGFFRPKQLRTFLLPSQEVWSSTEEGRWKMPNFEAILSNFRHLRAFDLHDTGIDEVPTSIGRLKHLRYLDVSKNDQIKALPNSISKLKNLQVLKLSDCEELEELPKDIKKLVNLRHLDCERCWNLRYVPRGLGRLTSLQMLTWFVVSENSFVSNHIGGLNELNKLHNLRGRIEIRNLKCVKNGVSEFEAANLREKPNLQSLSLCWNRDDDDNVNADYDEESLESLQPHQNLKKLKVCEYGGVKFPIWISSLTNLVDIWLQDCERCEHLPQLDHIPSLKYLRIHDFPNLEYISHEGDHFLNGGGRQEESTFFPSLKELYLLDCPKLKGWWKKRNDSDLAKKITTLPHFPSLSRLEIRDCPELTCMPLFPKLEGKLSLENASLEPLQQTIKMVIGVVPSTSSSSSMLGQHLLTLKLLWIVSIEDLESLPTELLQLTSLQELHLKDCPMLGSLPLGMHRLISLRELDIQDCAQLKERCGTSNCSDWQRVSHVPNIRIDGQKIQWEGNYLLNHKDSCSTAASPLSKTTSITYKDLESLPEGLLQNLTCLQELHIMHCPKLISLPRGMHHLTSLQLLDISQCPHLKERCGNNKGLDWCNISHIPNIQIDGTKIQWQGRYLLA